MMSVFQNARLTGIRHVPHQDKLILSFEHLPDRELTQVADFSFHGFFPHNVLFDLYEYSIHAVPARLAAEFPILAYYLHSGDEWQVFHLSPAAGLGGVVVCAVL